MSSKRSAIKVISKKLTYPVIAAEIGVRRGDHALGILEIFNVNKLYLIDHFLPYQDHKFFKTEEDQSRNLKILKERINPFLNLNKVELIIDSSENANKLFKDEFFDFIYIDASHDYESVKKDLLIWWKKVKKNGVLSGHDYKISGVNIALKEFIKELNLKLTSFGDSDWIIEKK